MILINILENEALKYPGVYRFVGRNPLKNNEEHPLYVGLAGKKAYNYFIGDKKGKEPQLLDGRLGRHLKNDAGVLGNIIDNINDLSKIEFWTMDPTEFTSEEIFITALEYLEYHVKTLENEIPYYDELHISRPPVPVDIDQKTREKVIQIFEKNMKTISLDETRISDIEDHFQLLFKIFTQTPVNQLIKFRQYNKARNAFENLVSYWKLIDKSRDYHWILFETEKAEQIPPIPGQAKARIEDFLVTEEPAFMGWEEWCTKYIKNDIYLFDVDAS